MAKYNLWHRANYLTILHRLLQMGLLLIWNKGKMPEKILH